MSKTKHNKSAKPNKPAAPKNESEMTIDERIAMASREIETTVARYNQLLGYKNALESLREAEKKAGN